MRTETVKQAECMRELTSNGCKFLMTSLLHVFGQALPRNASFIHWKVVGLVDYLFGK